jgi:hypothetical protein
MQESEERLLAHAEGGAQGVARHGGGGAAHERECPLSEGIGQAGIVAHEARPGPEVGVAGPELHAQGRRARGGPMLELRPGASRAASLGGREWWMASAVAANVELKNVTNHAFGDTNLDLRRLASDGTRASRTAPSSTASLFCRRPPPLAECA